MYTCSLSASRTCYLSLGTLPWTLFQSSAREWWASNVAAQPITWGLLGKEQGQRLAAPHPYLTGVLRREWVPPQQVQETVVVTCSPSLDLRM